MSRTQPQARTTDASRRPQVFAATVSVWRHWEQLGTFEVLLDTQGVTITRDTTREGVVFHPSQMRIGVHDPAVSTPHARLYIDATGRKPTPAIIDLRSSNGTWVYTTSDADSTSVVARGAPDLITSARISIGMLIRLGRSHDGYHLRVDKLTPQTPASPPSAKDSLVDLSKELNQELSQERLDALRRLFSVEPGRVLIYGGAGTGKSTWARALTDEWKDRTQGKNRSERKGEGKDRSASQGPMTINCSDNPDRVLSRRKGAPAPSVVEDIEYLSDVGQEDLCRLIDATDQLILTTCLTPERLRTWSRRTDLAPSLARMTMLSIPPLTDERDKRFFAEQFQNDYLGARCTSNDRHRRGDRTRARLSQRALDFIVGAEWPQGLLQLRDVITFAMLEIGLKNPHEDDLQEPTEVDDVDIAQTYARQDLVIRRHHYDNLSHDQFMQMAEETFMIHALVRERANLTRIGKEVFRQVDDADADKRPRRLLKALRGFWDGGPRLPAVRGRDA